MRNKLLAIAGLFLLAAWPAASRATPNMACQIQASSLMDQYLWPSEGGDNDFFTKKTGSTPNLLWILDNSCSMRDMPHMPSSGGCSDSFLNALGYSTYAPTCDSSWNCTYPNPAPDYDPTVPSWGGWTGLYQAGKAYYASNSWGGGADPATGRIGDINNVCNGMGSQATQCKTCIYTHGYYAEGGWGSVIADGNFLNVYPPKFVVARKVFKDVLMDPKLAMVRMGLMDYDGWVKTGLNPACNLADASATPSNFLSNRKSLSMKVEGLDRSKFDTDTPLADTVTHAEEYYTTPGYFNTTFGSGSVYNQFESKMTNNDKSVCWACQFNAIGVITDGMPFGDNHAVPDTIKNVTSSQCPGCAGQNLPKVAWWFYNHDVRSDWADFPGPQHVSVFTIGFGLSVPLLQETADVSGGKSYTGDNATQLEKAMGNITKEVAKRAITFTSANLSQVQSSATQSVFVPKLLPKQSGPWYGRLFRFRYISEFALNKDLNNDNQLNALFLVDADCPMNASAYASSIPANCAPIRAATSADVAALAGAVKLGDFYKTAGFYTNPTDPKYDLTTTPAKPVWEASQKLGNGPGQVSPDNRRVFTVVDGGANGTPDGKLDNTDVLRFNEANVDKILPYLDLTKASPFCAVWVDGGSSNPVHDCAKGLIAYVLGCTYGSTDPDSCTLRKDLLGDIFHSQPVLVTPPTEASVMNTPLRSPQDLLTLSQSDIPYSGTTPAYTLWSEGDPNSTPKAYIPTADPMGTVICHRNEFVLVGANDGMLHAFDAGHWHPDSGVSSPYGCHDAGSYDEGTGRELWAFIPPDLLPKLQYYGVAGFPHTLYVDGNPWVRDVWVDGLDPTNPAGPLTGKDGERESGEFQTLAVVGERRGGHHYFALDVTDGGHRDASNNPDYKPVFLWMFPKPGTKEELQVGESWNDTAQLPPPIGPIRYADPSGKGMNGPSTPWTEKWIVAVAGGYDAGHQARGRGFFMLDAWTGGVIWNFTRSAQDTTNVDGKTTSTSATAGVRKALKYSFAAPPALTGWGTDKMLSPGEDLAYYDTLVDGDTGGQVWVARFHDPNPANWSAGRLFIPNGKDSNPDNEPWHQPFFETPSLTWMPESGLLRTYIGTGNRAHLRDRSGGTCSVNDPMVCELSGQCADPSHAVDLEANKIKIQDAQQASDLDVGTSSWKQEDGTGTGSLNGGTIADCPNLELDVHTKMKNCNRYSGPKAPNVDFAVKTNCTYDATKNAYTCNQPLTNFLDPNAADPDLQCTDTSGTPVNRFYAIRVFGDTPFDDPGGATTYDTNRLTEADLVDVTSGTGPFASSIGPGWFYRYVDSTGANMISERTASAAVFAASSVVWATLAPDPGKPMACGGTSASTGGTAPSNVCPSTFSCPCVGSSNEQHAYTYFRDYVSGAHGQLNLGPYATATEVSMARKMTGSEPSPPRQPNIISQIGTGANAGKVQTSVADTGGSEASSKSNEDIYGQSDVIDVTRDVHDWRHAACGIASGKNYCQ